MAGKATILVVDDEAAVGQLLSEFLTTKGYDVICALGGLEGLSKLEKHRPDVVLLDVRMPDMDGITVLRRIREANPWVGVLMMSGNTDTEAAKETLALGAFDYVLKPFDFEYLDRAVHKMLTSAAPAAAETPGLQSTEAAPEPSQHGLLYDLAIEVFKATRAMGSEARSTLGPALEAAALTAVQKGVSGEKGEVIRALNHLRMLVRFARDLGDFSDPVHRHIETQIVKARRSVGLG
ncbi:MAG TPA: response regulator [Methylomirabilota bacterium]|nr:response regulator [Methylomirabilota bacterium]